ncbi:MAG: hypothetical protein Q8941_18140 [Bacteroidota bacterium]|nr:hypothetical protein [Bacteroidota bacterium]
MKKLFFILSFLFVTSSRLFAQDTDDNEGGEKIRDKMNEYIQQRLNLSKDEAEKFTPIFIRYFKEWRQTLRENKDLPRLDLQQKILELRLRYRNQFKDVIGERRSNEVFGHQETFIKTIRTLRQERLGNNPRPPLRRNRINRLL